jgi:hypothetical protein
MTNSFRKKEGGLELGLVPLVPMRPPFYPPDDQLSKRPPKRGSLLDQLFINGGLEGPGGTKPLTEPPSKK